MLINLYEMRKRKENILLSKIEFNLTAFRNTGKDAWVGVGWGGGG